MKQLKKIHVLINCGWLLRAEPCSMPVFPNELTSTALSGEGLGGIQIGSQVGNVVQAGRGAAEVQKAMCSCAGCGGGSASTNCLQQALLSSHSFVPSGDRVGGHNIPRPPPVLHGPSPA